jgi:hypothetical protein
MGGRLVLAGYLDVYRQYHRCGDPQARAQKMVAAVDEAWEGRMDNLPYKDQNQFVTMASIIEKETAVAAERDRWRRYLSTVCASACVCKPILP